MTDTAKLEAELRAGFEGVTPGPWTWEGSVYQHMAAEIVATRGLAQLWKSPNVVLDAAHIARCSPDDLRAILDAKDAEITTLRTQLDHCREAAFEEAARAIQCDCVDVCGESPEYEHGCCASVLASRIRTMGEKGGKG